MLIVAVTGEDMEIFTVSLFGHREVKSPQQLSKHLAPMIKDFIQTKPYVSFLIGRNGEFDEYAASIIKHVQKETGIENSDITLVLPYTVKDLEYYEKYYDSIIIPEAVQHAHPKSAIAQKNRWMIEQSDLVIACVEHDKGGAYAALKYAKKLNKDTVNLYEK